MKEACASLSAVERERSWMYCDGRMRVGWRGFVEDLERDTALSALRGSRGGGFGVAFVGFVRLLVVVDVIWDGGLGGVAPGSGGGRAVCFCDVAMMARH